MFSVITNSSSVFAGAGFLLDTIMVPLSGSAFFLPDDTSTVDESFSSSFVIFIVFKKLFVIHKKVEDAPPAPTEKECKYCKTKIHIDATRCPHCTSVIEEAAKPDES